MQDTILSVSDFIELVNQTLDFAYGHVVVEGEVAEYEMKQDKWIHFKLKDADSSVECFMTVWGLSLPIEDGMKIRLTGYPKLTKWGRFSLNVKSYTLAGEGAIKRALEILKAKLEKEGLFDESRKRALPMIPRTIGLITSIESEAYKDFCKIATERWGGVSIYVAAVQVQGLPAADQITAAINFMNQLAEPLDVLVITRGGGSAEDLQAFSAESVVRAIAASRTPTIVGVGHEGDISLADLAADVRASTPTDAARRVVPDRHEMARHISAQSNQLQAAITRTLVDKAHTVSQLTSGLEHFIQLPLKRVAELTSRLGHELAGLSFGISQQKQRLGQLSQSLVASESYLFKNVAQSFSALIRSLKNLDPKLVLTRGYAIIRKSGAIVKSAESVATGDELVLELAKDQIVTKVKEIRATN